MRTVTQHKQHQTTQGKSRPSCTGVSSKHSTAEEQRQAARNTAHGSTMRQIVASSHTPPHPLRGLHDTTGRTTHSTSDHKDRCRNTYSASDHKDGCETGGSTAVLCAGDQEASQGATTQLNTATAGLPHLTYDERKKRRPRT